MIYTALNVYRFTFLQYILIISSPVFGQFTHLIALDNLEHNIMYGSWDNTFTFKKKQPNGTFKNTTTKKVVAYVISNVP